MLHVAVPAEVAELFATLPRNKHTENDNKAKQQRSRNIAALALVASHLAGQQQTISSGV